MVSIVMNKRIDVEQVMEMANQLPSSPRNWKISALERATYLFYALAGFCAWQIGEWWGLGLVACIFVIDTLGKTAQQEYREELIEMHGALVLKIAENSTILDNDLPTAE